MAKVNSPNRLPCRTVILTAMAHHYRINLSEYLSQSGAELLTDNQVTALRILQPYTEIDDHKVAEYFPLLEFIQSSGTLRCLCLEQIRDVGVVQLLLNAASTNSTIEHLELEHINISGSYLFALLRTAMYRTVKIGDLSMLDFDFLDGVIRLCLDP
jgi:hypothetical protein